MLQLLQRTLVWHMCNWEAVNTNMHRLLSCGQQLVHPWQVCSRGQVWDALCTCTCSTMLCSAASLRVASMQPGVQKKTSELVSVLCGASNTPTDLLKSTIRHTSLLLGLPALQAGANHRHSFPDASRYAKPSLLRAFEEVDELLAESCQDYVAVPHVGGNSKLSFFQHQGTWISDLRCESCAPCHTNDACPWYC